MKYYPTEKIRNVVLIGHSGSGKTSLTEAMAYNSGVTTRMGKVEDGNTISDFDSEEVRRQISIYTTLVPLEWSEYKVNILDTPGYPDFVGETKGGIRAADAGIILVDAVSGVEVGTELTWNYLDERNLPRAVVIQKMNRDNANYERVLTELKEIFDVRFVLTQLPIGRQEDFKGVADLITMKAYMGDDKGPTDFPADLKDQAEELRVELIDAIAEQNDDILMKYLEGEDLTPEEITAGLQAGIGNGEIVPVFLTAATRNVGAVALMEAISSYFPHPGEMPAEIATCPGSEEEVELPPKADGPLAALVFKTVADPYVGKLNYLRVVSGEFHADTRVWNANRDEEERVGPVLVTRGKEQSHVEKLALGDIGAVAKLSVTATGDTLCLKDSQYLLKPPVYPHPLFSVAVHPKSKQDAAKIGTALTRLTEEDPTLTWHFEQGTKETILSGMGDIHIDIAVHHMESKFGVGINTTLPKVPYQETISRSASSSYRHKKQTGGAGQFAEVYMEVKPLPRGSGFEYDTSRVFGGAISNSFFPSIQKGIRSALDKGALAGYPVVDVRCEVFDGKEHPVDSKDIAFQIAGREVFKKAFMEAKPVLLEPIMKVRVIVPDEYVGDIMGDLNTRRAIIQGMGQEKGKSVITALVPLAEMQRYAIELRSITQGRGIFFMEYSHYEQVPEHVTEEVIAAIKREQEKKE